MQEPLRSIGGGGHIQLDDVGHIRQRLLPRALEILQGDQKPGIFQPPAGGHNLLIGFPGRKYLQHHAVARQSRGVPLDQGLTRTFDEGARAIGDLVDPLKIWSAGRGVFVGMAAVHRWPDFFLPGTGEKLVTIDPFVAVQDGLPGNKPVHNQKPLLPAVAPGAEPATAASAQTPVYRGHLLNRQRAGNLEPIIESGRKFPRQRQGGT